MTPEAARELWVRFVGGEELPAADQAALVAALEADPALRAELLEDVQLDGALRAVGDARRSGAAFAAAVGACLEPERDATRFLRKVEARLADLPPEPAGPGRDSRSNLPRISRRFHRRDSAGAGWMAALAAASALFALILLSAVVGRPPQVAAAPKAPAPVPAPPAPRPVPPPVAQPPPAEPKRLGDIRRELETLERTPAANPEDRARRVNDLRKEREAIEKEMREEIERLRAAPPPPAPESAPRPPAPTVTEKAVAEARGPKVESVFDQVYYARGQARVAVGAVLEHGQDIYTEGLGRVVLRYDDGTTVAIGPRAMARDLSGSAGRRLFVSYGGIASTIQPQPAGQPMIFETSHAKATIVGTRIRLTADKDPAVGTTLDVDEGKVSFQRLADRATVDVGARQTSTASSAVRDLRPRIAFPSEFMIRFAPADAPKEKDTFVDSGLPFSASRGFGWDGARDGQLVPDARQPDGSPVVMGRQAVWKMDLQDPRMRREDPRTSSIAAGWGAHAETWKIELPRGRYQVSVCVGDYTFEQGPHHVMIEGRQVVNSVMTKLPKTPHVVLTEEVEVTDGELNMKVGGYTAPRKSVDTSKDTLINYLAIKRVPAK